MWRYTKWKQQTNSKTSFNPFNVIVLMPRRLREYKLLLRSTYDSISEAIEDAIQRMRESLLYVWIKNKFEQQKRDNNNHRILWNFCLSRRIPWVRRFRIAVLEDWKGSCGTDLWNKFRDIANRLLSKFRERQWLKWMWKMFRMFRILLSLKLKSDLHFSIWFFIF